jgi:hypothetical protein
MSPDIAILTYCGACGIIEIHILSKAGVTPAFSLWKNIFAKAETISFAKTNILL